MSKPGLNSSALFTTPSFFKGTARIGDMFGQLDSYNYSKSAAQADQEALSRDWKIVGKEIANAINTFKKNAK